MSIKRLRVRAASLPLMPEDKEALEILRKEAEKEVKKDKGQPAVPEKIIKDNIDKKGKVWEKGNGEKEDKSSA